MQILQSFYKFFILLIVYSFLVHIPGFHLVHLIQLVLGVLPSSLFLAKVQLGLLHHFPTKASSHQRIPQIENVLIQGVQSVHDLVDGIKPLDFLFNQGEYVLLFISSVLAVVDILTAFLISLPSCGHLVPANVLAIVLVSLILQSLNLLNRPVPCLEVSLGHFFLKYAYRPVFRNKNEQYR